MRGPAPFAGREPRVPLSTGTGDHPDRDARQPPLPICLSAPRGPVKRRHTSHLDRVCVAKDQRQDLSSPPPTPRRPLPPSSCVGACQSACRREAAHTVSAEPSPLARWATILVCFLPKTNEKNNFWQTYVAVGRVSIRPPRVNSHGQNMKWRYLLFLAGYLRVVAVAAEADRFVFPPLPCPGRRSPQRSSSPVASHGLFFPDAQARAWAVFGGEAQGSLRRSTLLYHSCRCTFVKRRTLPLDENYWLEQARWLRMGGNGNRSAEPGCAGVGVGINAHPVGEAQCSPLKLRPAYLVC